MIFILSGPSGSGKTTLRDLILKDKYAKQRFVKSVSLSTRPRRPKEKAGRDYYFVTEEEFQKLRGSGKILEWTKYLGYYYGTKKDSVTSVLKSGKNLLLCLDFKGAMRVKKLYPKEAVTIFVVPPSLKELHRRIRGRSLETQDEEIRKRVRLAESELKNLSRYDYTLRNKNLGEALDKLKGIIFKRTGH